MIMHRDQLIGQKVIVRSNEASDELKTGCLIRFKKVGNKHMPVVVFDRPTTDHTEYVCAGMVVKWSTELEDFLQSLTPKRQWEILCDIVMSRSVLAC